MQLRSASVAVINLREDLRLRESARAGRTKKNAPFGAFTLDCSKGVSLSCLSLVSGPAHRQTLRSWLVIPQKQHLQPLRQ